LRRQKDGDAGCTYIFSAITEGTLCFFVEEWVQKQCFSKKKKKEGKLQEYHGTP